MAMEGNGNTVVLEGRVPLVHYRRAVGRATHPITHAGHADAVEFSVGGAGQHPAAAGGSVADADDAFHCNIPYGLSHIRELFIN